MIQVISSIITFAILFTFVLFVSRVLILLRLYSMREYIWHRMSDVCNTNIIQKLSAGIKILNECFEKKQD